tara:strand:+ start:145 stop:567 length:423 start_codon:yes stop_codon:yes gene_type:complete
MKTYQKEIKLNAYSRGFHIIDTEIESSIPEMKSISKGILHVFIKHTSASIIINENADPSVRNDMENYFNKTVPENEPYFTHTHEGTDDMPAHIKSSMLGSGVIIPISEGKLNLGVWQGIYLCEHRNQAQSRKIILTLMGS